jgi:hypothetical protein
MDRPQRFYKIDQPLKDCNVVTLRRSGIRSACRGRR